MKTKLIVMTLGLAPVLFVTGCSAPAVRNSSLDSTPSTPAREPVELTVTVLPNEADVWLLSRGLGRFHPFLATGQSIGQSTIIPASEIESTAVLYVQAPMHWAQAFEFRPIERQEFAIEMRPLKPGEYEPQTAAERLGDNVRLALLSPAERATELAQREEARIRDRTKRIGDFELFWEFVSDGNGESQYTRLAGTVKNVGTHVVARLPVRVDVWNEAGSEVIHSDWTFAVDTLPLRPGDKRRWEIMVEKPTPRISVSLGQPMDRL